MEGLSRRLYDYASYSIPICLAKVGSLPVFTTVVGFWAPFGSFLTGLASYAGSAFWSQTAGLVARTGTFLLPDAGLLNIAHPNYGDFVVLNIFLLPGFYAVAVAGTALILVVLERAKDNAPG